MESILKEIARHGTISLSDFISRPGPKIKEDLEEMGLIEAMKSGANERNVRKFFKSCGVSHFGFLHYPLSRFTELFWKGRFWKRAVVQVVSYKDSWMITVAGWEKMVDIMYSGLGLGQKELTVVSTTALIEEDNAEIF